MLINNIRKSPTFPIRNTIHAPTRGATKQRWLKLFGGYLSIHAPTRGATFPPNASLTFSSLSIHAPTRGATLQGRQF